MGRKSAQLRRRWIYDLISLDGWILPALYDRATVTSDTLAAASRAESHQCRQEIFLQTLAGFPAAAAAKASDALYIGDI